MDAPVLALAGGFGRLASIGQAFSAPAVPVTSALAVPASHPYPAPLPGRAAGTNVAAVTGPSGAAPVAPQGAGAATGGGETVQAGGSGGSFGEVQTGSGGQGALGGRTTTPPAQVPPPVTAPQPCGTIVDGVVGVGTSVTAPLTGPIGSLATQALQSLGSTIDRILSLRPAARLRSVTGTLLSGLQAR